MTAALTNSLVKKKQKSDICCWGGSGGLIGAERQYWPSFQFVELSFKRSAKEERVINRLEVISEVSGFLPGLPSDNALRLQASRESSILLTCLGETGSRNSSGQWVTRNKDLWCGVL